MYSTTDAIVLSLQPQSDKAHVLHAYTRAGGRINYKVFGLGKRHAAGLYSPLSLIQITANHTAAKMPTVKEAVSLTAQRSYSDNGLSANASERSYSAAIYKQTIRLFICEVLYHVLRHPMQDEPMFDFIAEAVQELDQTKEPQNFHLQFLIGLAAKLGFGIPENSDLLTNPLTRAERQKSLRALCAYFAEHVETWEEPKSLDILMEVFD